MMERRRASVILLSVALVAVVVGVVALSGGTDRPDVLVISINSLRADHLSCYGYERNTTPEICGVAGEGTRYTRAYSQFYWTTPSEASIQSSLYPGVHQVYRSVGGSTVELPSTPTMPEVLSSAGYSTYAAVPTGRWGYREGTGLTRGFEEVDSMSGVSSRTDQIVDRLTSPGEDLVYTMPMGLHRPYTHDWGQAGERYTEGYNGTLARFQEQDGDLPTRLLINATRTTEGYQLRYQGEVIELTQEDIAYLRGEYDNMLRHIDEQVGEIVEGLRRAGTYDETLIVITSPHGETLADDRPYPDGRPFGHLYNYEEVLRVPLIVRPPGGSPVGTVTEPVELIDLYPTVLDWVGIDAPDVLQGGSIRPPYEPGDAYTFSGRRVVRNKSWKFMYTRPTFPDGPVLYSLSEPPERRENLRGQYPGKVDAFRTRIQEWRDRNELLHSRLASE